MLCMCSVAISHCTAGTYIDHSNFAFQSPIGAAQCRNLSNMSTNAKEVSADWLLSAKLLFFGSATEEMPSPSPSSSSAASIISRSGTPAKGLVATAAAVAPFLERGKEHRRRTQLHYSGEDARVACSLCWE